MKCPFCEKDNTKVVDSRNISDGRAIRRRRECVQCNQRFTTFEKYETEQPVTVRKKNGEREEFDREKILKGLRRATEKRNISIEQLDTIILNIEKKVYNSLKREITTSFIGELIMEELKNLDGVAYVRFASVYKEFKDLESFEKEIDYIKK